MKLSSLIESPGLRSIDWISDLLCEAEVRIGAASEAVSNPMLIFTRKGTPTASLSPTDSSLLSCVVLDHCC